MRLQFSKYHGAGNDFIIIDGRTVTQELSAEQVLLLCHRHYGIGADGLIILFPGNDAQTGYRMQYFNADGREGSMCGNGARCAYAFAITVKLAEGPTRFIAYDGVHDARSTEEGLVTISMGDVSDIRRISKHSYVLDTGSPHVVRFVEDLGQVNAFEEGRSVRNSPEFARYGINVNFVQVVGESALRIRTYERGVENLTLACGTGVTAAALAYAEQQGLTSGIIAVHADGGELSVSFKRSAGKVTEIFLTGPVQHVFDGVVDVDS
jgi:diaminopimelate epimerase